MNTVSKIKIRAILQYCLVVAVVFFLGTWLRGKASAEEVAEETEKIFPGLPIYGDAKNDYPEVKLGSKKALNKYIKESPTNDIVLEGEGMISNHQVDVVCVLHPDGTVIGRYHNTNGTNLDLNGYIEPDSRNLKIHLGHEDNKTLSNWILSPQDCETGQSSYHYVGTWGRKNLPSELTLKIKNDGKSI